MRGASYQNVTLALPASLLREVEQLAADNQVSLSRFVARVLEERTRAARAYPAARERQRKLLKEGLPLGSERSIDWDRDQLHER
jgi:hypothetical protein